MMRLAARWQLLHRVHLQVEALKVSTAGWTPSTRVNALRRALKHLSASAAVVSSHYACENLYRHTHTHTPPPPLRMQQ